MIIDLVILVSWIKGLAYMQYETFAYSTLLLVLNPGVGFPNVKTLLYQSLTDLISNEKARGGGIGVFLISSNLLDYRECSIFDVFRQMYFNTWLQNENFKYFFLCKKFACH